MKYMTNGMPKNSTITSKREWRLSMLPDYLRALHHPVYFVVLERCNGTWMAKCRGWVKGRVLALLCLQKQRKITKTRVMREDVRLGFGRSIFWIKVTVASRAFVTCIWYIYIYTPATNLHSVRYCNSFNTITTYLIFTATLERFIQSRIFIYKITSILPRTHFRLPPWKPIKISLLILRIF
jgi:hypothetical protein